MSEKQEQTPRDKIARLAAMTDQEFSAFMRWNFARICKEPLPSESTVTRPNQREGT
jgi:hypothetical protein